MIVVSDTTPIIALIKIGLLDILHSLYGQVLIPQEVFDELTTSPKYLDEAKIIRQCQYICTCQVQDKTAIDIIRRLTSLDIGESAAIVLFTEQNADLLLVDELSGRKAAQRMGIRITGTVGILLAAFDGGLMSSDSVHDAIVKLRLSGIRLSDNLCELAFRYINMPH